MQRPLCWMSVSNGNSDLASLARCFDGDIDELSDHVDVGGGMASQTSRQRGAASGKREWQMELIGSDVSTLGCCCPGRRLGCYRPLSYSGAVHDNGLSPQLLHTSAECGS